MHPELFTIFGKTITTYGLMAMLGLLSAIATWTYLLRRHPGFSPDLPGTLGILLILSGLVGARIAYVAANWSDFAPAPLEILRVDHGGLIFYGGLVLASCALVVYAFTARIPLWRLADFAIPGLAVGHAFGRVGCFLFGCCHGCPAGRFPALGIAFPPSTPLGEATASAPLYPVQLWEAAALLAIWFVLLRLHARPRRLPGAVFAAYLLLYPPVRFALEFLRGDPRQPATASLDVAQIVSLALFAAGIALVAFPRLFGRKPLPPEPEPAP